MSVLDVYNMQKNNNLNVMEKQRWLLPGIEGGPNTCPCCPSTVDILPLDTRLHHCYGGWSVTKNGDHFFQEDRDVDFEDAHTLQDIENRISDDDVNEYRAILMMALRDATYQRHSKGKWVLIEKGPGYA